RMGQAHRGRAPRRPPLAPGHRRELEPQRPMVGDELRRDTDGLADALPLDLDGNLAASGLVQDTARWMIDVDTLAVDRDELVAFPKPDGFCGSVLQNPCNALLLQVLGSADGDQREENHERSRQVERGGNRANQRTLASLGHAFQAPASRSLIMRAMP